MRLTTKGRFAVTAMVDLAMRQTRRSRHAGGHQRAPAYFAFLSGAAVRQAAPPQARLSVRARAAVQPRAAAGRRFRSAAIVTAVDEPLDATQCGGRRIATTTSAGMTHDLWALSTRKCTTTSLR